VVASASGVLARILAGDGQIMKSGDALAVIAASDEPRDTTAIERALAESGR
jgi:pyruvate/2-oxoglutarate dehydrogenase complex dihydrolipoamide acyltransferase (E2) component